MRLTAPHEGFPPALMEISYHEYRWAYEDRPHRHSGAEIICCYSGYAVLDTERGSCSLPGASIALIDATVSHRLKVVSPPYGRWLVHLELDALSPFIAPKLRAIPLMRSYRLSLKQNLRLLQAYQRIYRGLQSEERVRVQDTDRALQHLLRMVIGIIQSQQPVAMEGQGSEEGQRVVSTVLDMLHHVPADGLDVADLALRVGYSTGHLQRLFRREMGMSISEYVAIQRIERAQDLLLRAHPTLSIEAIAKALGFTSIFYFSRYFRLHTGCSPTEYRRMMQEDHAPVTALR